MRNAHHHHPLGCEAEGIKTGTMRRAVFGERHLFSDPEDAASFPGMSGQAQSKAGRCSNMRLPWCCDFMQGATQEPAAKNLINRWNAQRQGTDLVFKSRSSLQSQQAMAQLCNHKPLETRSYSIRSQSLFMFCSI